MDGVAILALAGVTYISSSGVIARLLEDLHRLGNRETPAVLSVLVLEDFAMAAYLPLFAVLASGGNWLQAVAGMLVAVGALLAAFTASFHWGHHFGRLVEHPDSEQLLLRVLGVTLMVAALAESLHASAAVGAFLVGLTLTGDTAERARQVLGPLRDLFAAIFFVAIGLQVDPHELVPVLPVALILAVVTAATKVATGVFAARRDGVGRRGQLRAGHGAHRQGRILPDHHRIGRCVDPRGGRAGDLVCLRHGDSGPGAGSFHRRPPAGGRQLGHLKHQPMCRATTCHRAPVPEFPAGSCSTRQAMAWIRSPRLYVPKTSAAVSGSCRPTGCTRIRRSTAAASDPAPDPTSARPAESTESTRLGASSGRSWAAGRRRSMTSSTRRSAASAKMAAWRMGGDMTVRRRRRLRVRIAELAGPTGDTAPQRRVR